MYYPHTFEPFALITGGDIREQEDSQGRTLHPAGRVCFYHNNVNGAPVRLTDSSGDIVWSLQAGAWGDKSQITEGQLYNPLRYQGQYFDDESGLHYNRYRYYDPETGVFISQDPIGLLGGLNPYQFAVNTLMWADPLGLAGGRLGNQETRDHVSRVADQLERMGYEITGGGGRLPEEYIPGPNGARKGSSYPDITATKNGKIVRINTVDTRADNETMTTRESKNAKKIREQKPEDILLTIPKPKKKPNPKGSDIH